jgi:hypothetical protein
MVDRRLVLAGGLAGAWLAWLLFWWRVSWQAQTWTLWLQGAMEAEEQSGRGWPRHPPGVSNEIPYGWSA